MATLTPAPRLRGREQELQALGDAFDQVASGHPAVVIVEGEAGIGKTRLLAEAMHLLVGAPWSRASPPRARPSRRRRQCLRTTRSGAPGFQIVTSMWPPPTSTAAAPVRSAA